MDEARGSVRIGPISLFVLIIALCLAVLAVLSFQTARAQAAVTQQQATTVGDTYRNEVQAQEFLASLDGVLASSRASGQNGQSGAGAISAFVDSYNDRLGNQGAGKIAEVSYDSANGRMHALFEQASGRRLVVSLQINSNLTYSVLSWRASTEWIEPGSGNILWEG